MAAALAVAAAVPAPLVVVAAVAQGLLRAMVTWPAAGSDVVHLAVAAANRMALVEHRAPVAVWPAVVAEGAVAVAEPRLVRRAAAYCQAAHPRRGVAAAAAVRMLLAESSCWFAAPSPAQMA